jgi:lipoic acid synthetase
MKQPNIMGIQMKPKWLKTEIASGSSFFEIKNILAKSNLNTVCLEAHCPNQGECFNSGTATFLIMGKLCTRNCNYCAVEKGIPLPLDKNEPQKIAQAVKQLGLSYAVITSVTRDDLPDGGAAHFAETIAQIKKENNSTQVEVLIPDFNATTDFSLQKIVNAKPDVINHNIEVAKPLYTKLRPRGSYNKSLSILNGIAKYMIPAKSGIMVGFGENIDDIKTTFEDLLENKCSLLTIGQYLQPDSKKYPVKKYYHPDEFSALKKLALKMGFKKVKSGPLVRSSYHAKELMI